MTTETFEKLKRRSSIEVLAYRIYRKIEETVDNKGYRRPKLSKIRRDGRQ
ncbi:hypothetical protein [Bacillus sp. UNC41MFS5]|nr:hypothetical protein [Bacillus sp. UNC41MFS5]